MKRFVLRTLTALALAGSVSAHAQSGSLASAGNAPSAGEAVDGASAHASISYPPILLPGGSRLTLVSPGQWRDLGRSLADVLERTHREYSKLFGSSRRVTTTLKLMESESFYRTTKTPRWTNAMYYKGQIIIPIDDHAKLDGDNLVRSVRHEYLHAVLHDLSAGKCPGWLDEGLAQWAEGDENSALEPALKRWLSKNPPVSLSLLQGGFTRLESKMVPAAYSQSLVAAKHIIARYGFSGIRDYLEALGDGETKADAFLLAFGRTEEEFEEELGILLEKRFRR